ncbi:hypothetical protein SK571_40090 [Lentzea sp. BCCO 10_0798]|uniref:AAA domain-containing protein n=1 Tax=Lentzea kristufekii TaxID=3095430 RepID=A0ABU4U4W6_9PSEU|nr:hypothetical protein [Lentzea sp. BCCO 10_0798]MDX8055614.1 hypothetical protein [Lentzea sp. BCCO 10_0798]
MDACYSQNGIEGAAQAMLQPGSANADKEFWLIAASRRRERAQQGRFADAFAKWLTRHSAPSWTSAHFEPSIMVNDITTELRATQSARLLTGSELGCRALPNPQYQNPAPPAAKELPITVPWAAHARGVSSSTQPGYFFTGRTLAMMVIRQHATARTPETLLVTGVPKSGKSAVLGHFMITTAAPQLLPAEQRLLWPSQKVRAVAATGTRTAVINRLAEEFGVASRDFDALVTALQTTDGLVVVLDQLHEKDDWTDLLGALTGAPGVRLVVGLPNDTIVEVPGATRNCDLDRFGGYPDQDVHDYVLRRLALSEPPERGSSAAKLAVRWGISFAVAVAAMSAYQAEDGRAGNAKARGDRHGAKAAQRLCIEVLSAQFDEDIAQALVESLWGLCSYDESIALTATTWAVVATQENGEPVDADALAACAERLRPLVVNMPGQDGSARWRPTLSFAPEERERTRTAGISTRSRFLARLPELAAPDEVDWETIDPAVRVLVAHGAKEQTAHGRLIDQPGFLLDAAPAVVQMAVRLLERDELARRSRVMRVLAVRAPRDDRALLLEIAARRFKVPVLAGRTSRAPEVEWVQPDRPHLERLTHLAAYCGSVVVTMNAEDALEFFLITSGAPARSKLEMTDAVPKSLSAATVDDEDVVLVTTTNGELWLVRCGQDGPAERLPLDMKPDSAELHDSGLMVLTLGNEVWTAPLRSSHARRFTTLDSDVRSTHLTGSLEQPICWCVTVNGRVRRLRLHDQDGTDVSTLPVRKALRQTAASPDGQRFLAVDTANILHLRNANQKRDLPHGKAVHGVRAAALDHRGAVIGCASGDVKGKLVQYSFTGGEAPVEVVLDDEPIWVALTASSSVLVARPSGLLSLKPPAPLQPDER